MNKYAFTTIFTFTFSLIYFSAFSTSCIENSESVLTANCDITRLTDEKGNRDLNSPLEFTLNNDNPCEAAYLNCGIPKAGTTLGATSSFISPSCSFGQTNDVFYEIYAQTEREYTITVSGANNNLTLAAYTGSCDGVLTEIACATGIFTDTRIINFSVSSNQYVLIQTFSTFNSGGAFEIVADCSQPINNLPCDALTLHCGETLSGNSTTAVTGGVGGYCGSNGSVQDLFYQFDAGEGSTYTILVNGSNYDGTLTLYTLGYPGNCNSGRTFIACENASAIPGVAESFTYTATESRTVLIQTYDWRAQTGGEFNISLSCEFPNDEPCNATEITCGQFIGGTTVGATQSSLGATSCAFGSQKDVFYKIEAIAGINYTATVIGTNYDGLLAAYTGSCSGTLTEIDCSDSGFTDNMTETIHFAVAFDRTVYIRTYDYYTNGGDFALHVTCTNLPYDEPCDARSLACGETFSGSSSGATTSSIGSPSCNGPYGRKDIFFKFYALANVDYSVTVNGANYNALIAAYTGSCSGSLTEIDCSNIGSLNGIAETLNINVPTNQLITLQVYDVITASGTASDYTIMLSCLTPPSNDSCESAMPLGVNDSGLCPSFQVQGTTIGATTSNPDACDPSSPDVYFVFNSSTKNEVIVNLDALSAEDLVLSIFETSSCNTPAIYCNVGTSQSSTITVIPYTTYYARVHTRLGYQTGTFNICIEEVPQIATINGSIVGWNANCAPRNVKVYLINESTFEDYPIITTTLNTGGTFIIGNDANIAPGIYGVWVKVDGALSKTTYNVMLNAGNNSFSVGPVVRGDVNNNNGINILDYSAMSLAFNTAVGNPSYNLFADLNCDGVINILDVSILGLGNGQAGDSFPGP